MDADNTASNSLKHHDETHHDETGANWSYIAPLVALGVGLIAVTIFAFNERSEIDSLTQQAESHQQEIASLQSRMAAADSTLSGTVGNLQDQLAKEEEKTSQSIAGVENAAKRHAEVIAQNLKKNVDQQTSAQQEKQEALNAELANMKSAATDASAKIDGAMSRIDNVGADVDSVKTDLASTKTSADGTKSDLQRARGDMGVMSGLIATNSKEIGELRALGDRNIYEFNITKKAGPQKVGDVQIRLSKADPKRSIYTMVVLANDKSIEKRDKTSNEPVQFYVGSGGRTPYEVVVNEVSKDMIKGYLATPRVTTASK